MLMHADNRGVECWWLRMETKITKIVQAYFPRLHSWGAEISVRHLLHHNVGAAGKNGVL